MLWFPFTTDPCRPFSQETYCLILLWLLPYWWLSCTKKTTGRMLLSKKFPLAAVCSQNCVRELLGWNTTLVFLHISVTWSVPHLHNENELCLLSVSVGLWIFIPISCSWVPLANVRCCSGEKEKQMQTKEELCIHSQKSRQKRSHNTY